MTVTFCPDCFHEVDPAALSCPACGGEIHQQLTYEEALIRALKHRLGDRRVLAATILGKQRSQAAIPHLIAAADDPTDPCLAAEAAAALGRIGGPEPERALRRLARSGRWSAVKQAARLALSAATPPRPESAAGVEDETPA